MKRNQTEKDLLLPVADVKDDKKNNRRSSVAVEVNKQNTEELLPMNEKVAERSKTVTDGNNINSSQAELVQQIQKY